VDKICIHHVAIKTFVARMSLSGIREIVVTRYPVLRKLHTGYKSVNYFY